MAEQAIAIGLVRAALGAQSMALSKLIRRCEKLVSDAEVKRAVNTLAEQGEVVLRPEAESPRGVIQSSLFFDVFLQRSEAGKKDSLWSTLDTVVYQAVSGERKRHLHPGLGQWLDQLPEDPLRLSVLATALGPLFTVVEVRSSVLRLASAGCLKLEFQPGDVLLCSVPTTEFRLPPPMSPRPITGPVVPDPEPAQQVAATAGETVISRAVGAIRGRKRPSS